MTKYNISTAEALYVLFNNTGFKQIKNKILSKNLRVQKTIFILTKLGIFKNTYTFKYYAYGPYSAGLNNDLYDYSLNESFFSKNHNLKNIKFKKECVGKLNNFVVNLNTELKKETVDVLLQTIASILLIRDNYDISTSDAAIRYSVKNSVDSDVLERAVVIIQNLKV